MSDAQFVQADRGPDVEVILTKVGAGSGPEDLTGASVFFQMRKADDRRYTVNAEAEIVGDPTDGFVRYQWGVNDLGVPGLYEVVQFEIHYPDGKEKTTKTPLVFEVRRQ